MKRKGGPVGAPAVDICEFKSPEGVRCWEIGTHGFGANIWTGAHGHWFCVAHRHAGERLLTASPDDRAEREARMRGPGRQERLF